MESRSYTGTMAELTIKDRGMIANALKNKNILVTGHSGFTGAWLSAWLQRLGAGVYGIGLPPHTNPSLYEFCAPHLWQQSHFIDINDAATLKERMRAIAPDLVIHLAAQPIVSMGYSDPAGTFATNVMGTFNVLDAASQIESVKGAICITTDKVYQNREWCWGYRENDPLGGDDPYSASKSAAEMVIRSFQFTLAPRRNRMQVVSVRGGNIIGGGDWSADRIVVDYVKAVTGAGSISLRNPGATRPWQHVLCLCHGYVELAARILDGKDRSAEGCWNFGPSNDGNVSVSVLLTELAKHWKEVKINQPAQTFKESHFLHLNSDKARMELAWAPRLSFAETVEWTTAWYREFYENKAEPLELMRGQLEAYLAR